MPQNNVITEAISTNVDAVVEGVTTLIDSFLPGK
jgi:hypothetical protein